MEITEHHRKFNLPAWSSILHAVPGWTRKPRSADYVEASTDEADLKAHLGPYWDALPEVTDLDLHGVPGEEWWSEFTPEANETFRPGGDISITTFILTVPEGRFLVRTEGYDYIRYATRLV